MSKCNHSIRDSSRKRSILREDAAGIDTAITARLNSVVSDLERNRLKQALSQTDQLVKELNAISEPVINELGMPRLARLKTEVGYGIQVLREGDRRTSVSTFMSAFRAWVDGRPAKNDSAG